MAKRKQYVKYEDVALGLHRPGRCGWAIGRKGEEWGCDPASYIKYLREKTGLSYSKIAHDLRVDSGTDVADSTVALWGRK